MSWTPPDGFARIRTVDLHTAGEPLRVITDGAPQPEGSTMLDKRRWLQQHGEPLRRSLMGEPRGHADMYGCLLTPPVTDDGDVGVLFLHNEGYSTMCGHGVIAVVTAGLECGLIAATREPDVVRLDTPAGRVTAIAHRRGDRVEQVSFRNVPSFVLQQNLQVDVPELGRVRCDLAFGGAFYAYVDAEPLGLSLEPAAAPRLIAAGMAIKEAVQSAHPVAHPSGDLDLEFLYGTIFVGPPVAASAHSRNVCIFANGELDRSPTGTGVSGRAAIHWTRDQLAMGESIVVESILGTQFNVTAVEETRVGPLPAIVPEVTGSAYVTGRHEFLFDPGDPLRGGFFLR